MRLRGSIAATVSLCLPVALGFSAETGPDSITAKEIIAHVQRLADEHMQGRGNGSPELDEAAEYIAAQLRSYGLKPAFTDSFFQVFDITVRTDFAPESRVAIVSGESRQELALFEGFLPMGLGDENKISGEVVFAGYGIVTQTPPYDEYKDIDVTDKIVVLMTHAPREKEEVKSGEDQLALQATLSSKAINARMHGAKGVVIVADPLHAEDEREALPPFKAGGSAEEWGLPVVAVHMPVVKQLLADAGKDFGALQVAIDGDLAPRSFGLPGVRVEIDLTATKTKKAVRNVAAMVPGTSPEVIVIGAHYDHLGLGEKNSLAPRLIGQPHLGADDNASGVAGVLELAQAFAATKPPRTLLFTTFAGEELGLLGSSYFAKNPPVPMERIVAMINMDMIGRPKNNKVYVNGVGTSPGFKGMVEAAGKEAKVEVSLSQSGYGASDQTSFVSRGVPVLFFFSGLHADYHKPSDTWDKVDGDAERRLLRLAYRLIDDLGALRERPAYVRVAEPAAVGGRSGGSYGVYFGSIPDFGEEVKGVKFADVRDGSPAAKAGLRAGDILVRFDTTEIKNLYDFTYALKAHKPGQTVPVVVVREGNELSVTVTLEKRE